VAQYRLCADHVFPGSVFVPAGTIVSDLPGGVLPPAFPPTPYMDALDADAVTQMAAAGVQLIGSCVRMSSVPACRWVIDPNVLYSPRTVVGRRVLHGKALSNKPTRSQKCRS